MKLNLAQLTINTVSSDTRKPITSTAVPRPTREILASLNETARQTAWESVVSKVAEMHGTNVEAKGALWTVNDDEAARVLRVNYNQIKPDYQRGDMKMTLEGSQQLWAQICEQLGKDEPAFTDKDENS